MRRGDALDSELAVSYNSIALPASAFETTLVRLRLSYSFTPRMFAQGLVQYNDVDQIWSANLRFGWLQQANTGLFVVYNDRHPLDEYAFQPLDRRGTDRSLVVKFSRMFDVLD